MDRSSSRRRRYGFISWGCAAFALMLWVPQLLAQQPVTDSTDQQTDPPSVTDSTGAIRGRVVDQLSGEPLVGARIVLVDRTEAAETGSNGRFEIGGLRPKLYTVLAGFIGYRAQQIDSVWVDAGRVTTLDFALGKMVNVSSSDTAVTLQDLVSQSQATASKASNAGLLANQQAAAAASDGVSAESMAKTPDATASAAITRVTGVTVVDNKFVVIRGLGERYTNTLLNGSELASPEPLKRVVPLDVFPANLLESIITTKAATPDRPGDFAGGSVEIKTKEFPSQFTAQFKLSQTWNSETTFRPVVRGPRSFSDFFGFDNGRRGMPSIMPTLADNAPPAHGTEQALRAELFGESLRDVWTPTPTSAAPNLGFAFNVGGQTGAESSNPLGYVLSLNYSNGMSAVRDRIYRLAGGAGLATNAIDNRINEDQASVDWGGIFNLSTKLGAAHKISWKNFYTRNAEETFFNGYTFLQEFGGDGRLYQVRYIERSTLQTQLAGDHLFGFLGNTRLEWKGSYSQAKRDEPENRQQIYGVGTDGQEFASLTGAYNMLQFRFLTDNTYTGQADLSIPFGFRAPSDAILKFGGLRRTRSRDFNGRRILLSGFSDGTPDDFARELPPEQFWSPEVIGEILTFVNGGTNANSYESSDDVTAVYGMADFPLFPSVRLVGGLRVEQWALDVFAPDRATVDAGLGSPPVMRRNRDYLWSGNLTAALGPRTNLRLAGFTTVIRPDPRELTPEAYFAVGGECSQLGDTAVQRTKVVNGDLKWEFFPRSGEVVSVSAYYKRFTTPIINTVGSSSNGCRIRFANAKSAYVYGSEFEFRKALDFLGSTLAPFSLSLNFSVTKSRAELDPFFSGAVIADSVHPPLQAQSPYVINAGLSYDDPAGRFSASVLYNRFGNRVAQYGTSSQFGNNEATIVSDRIEQGRGTLDAKLTRRLSGGLSVTLSGKNLTNSLVIVTQDTPNLGLIRVNQYRPGTTISLGAGYDF